MFEFSSLGDVFLVGGGPPVRLTVLTTWSAQQMIETSLKYSILLL